MMNEHIHDDERLDEILKEDLTMEPPPEIEARLRKRLDAFRERMEQAETAKKAPVYRVVFEKVYTMEYGWAKAAAVALVAIVLLTVVAPWDSPGLAFADVVERVKALVTLAYDMTVELEGQKPMQSRAMWRRPGRTRVEIESGSVFIFDPIESKSLTLHHATKTATIMNMGSQPMPGKARQNIVDTLDSLLDGTEERLGEKRIDGKDAVGFHVRKGSLEATIWADPETGLPIHVTMELKEYGQTKVVSSNFVFNPELDEALFSLTPPEGYTSQKMDIPVDTSPPSEKDLIEALRLCADSGAAQFPAEFNTPALAKATALKKGKPVSTEELAGVMVVITRAAIFAHNLKPGNDWHYRGKDVRIGDAKAALCWWKPDGSQTYRLVMGDLKVRDVPASEIPRAPEGK